MVRQQTHNLLVPGSNQAGLVKKPFVASGYERLLLHRGAEVPSATHVLPGDKNKNARSNRRGRRSRGRGVVGQVRPGCSASNRSAVRTAQECRSGGRGLPPSSPATAGPSRGP